MLSSQHRIQGTTGVRDRAVALSPFYAPAFRGGGPIRTLRSLLLAAPKDIMVAVATGDRDIGESTRLSVDRNCWTSVDGVRCYYASARNPVKLLRLYFTIARWRPSILYFNGFFVVHLTIVPLILRRLGWCSRASLLLAPRGEFSPGALAIRSRKKRMYIAANKLFRLSSQVVWHASTADEAADIRGVFGSSARILIRENEMRFLHWLRYQSTRTLCLGSLSLVASRQRRDWTSYLEH